MKWQLVLTYLEGNFIDSVTWGPWISEGPCSASCGGGYQFFQRECLDILDETVRPTWWCHGGTRNFERCNMHACPGLHKQFSFL